MIWGEKFRKQSLTKQYQKVHLAAVLELSIVLQSSSADSFSSCQWGEVKILWTKAPQQLLNGSCVEIVWLYITLYGDIINCHHVNYRFLLMTHNRTSLSRQMTPMHCKLSCLTDINIWMSKNFLKLNEEKTEMLLIGTKTQREKKTALNANRFNFNSHFNKVIKTSEWILKFFYWFIKL